jgi:hypothetical protein
MTQTKTTFPTSHTTHPNSTDAKNRSGELMSGLVGSACTAIGTLIGESLVRVLERKCSK